MMEFIWNHSTCKCECDKSCDVGENLDYVNCKCKKILIDQVFEECTEDVNGNEIIYNATLCNHEKICNFCTLDIVLLIITFIIIISIIGACIYFHWHTIKNSFNKLPY